MTAPPLLNLVTSAALRKRARGAVVGREPTALARLASPAADGGRRRSQLARRVVMTLGLPVALVAVSVASAAAFVWSAGGEMLGEGRFGLDEILLVAAMLLLAAGVAAQVHAVGSRVPPYARWREQRWESSWGPPWPRPLLDLVDAPELARAAPSDIGAVGQGRRAFFHLSRAQGAMLWLVLLAMMVGVLVAGVVALLVSAVTDGANGLIGVGTVLRLVLAALLCVALWSTLRAGWVEVRNRHRRRRRRRIPRLGSVVAPVRGAVLTAQRGLLGASAWTLAAALLASAALLGANDPRADGGASPPVVTPSAVVVSATESPSATVRPTPSSTASPSATPTASPTPSPTATPVTATPVPVTPRPPTPVPPTPVPPNPVPSPTPLLDFDNDNFSDADEVRFRSDPLDPLSTPEHRDVLRTCSDGFNNDLREGADPNDPDCQ